MEERTKIYFASDCHLGVPNADSSLVREKLFVKWLDSIKADAKEIYLLGDIFDFWFEYRTVVTRGYVRLLGKLAELSDSGIVIYYFAGNHDMWLYDYFSKEINIKLYKHPIEKQFGNKLFLVGHGDGLGKADYGYKFIKRVFSNSVCQFLFSWLHPTFGSCIARFFSQKSRAANGKKDEVFLGEDKERLIGYCKKMLETKHYDYFVFGHRHLPMDIKLNPSSNYINTGDWISHFSYAVFDGDKLELKNFENKNNL